MKRSLLFFTAILVPFDALAVFAGAIVAYHLRLTPFFTELRPVVFDLTIERYSGLALPATLLWILVFALAGAYRTTKRPLLEELKTLLLGSASAMAIIFALLFFILEAFESRFIVLAGWALAVLFLWAERLLVRGIQRSLYFLKIGAARTAIIGENESSHLLKETFEARKRLGTDVVATYTHFNKETEEDLKHLARTGRIDDVLFLDSDADHETLVRLKDFTDTEHVTLRYGADLLSVGANRATIDTVAGVLILTVKKTPLDGWGAIYKRAFDIIASATFLLVLLPLMLLTSIIILLESGRPILFRNERVGESNRRFQTLKFRSMRAEWSVGSQKGLGNQREALAFEQELIRNKSLKGGPVYKINGDPRVTPFGKFIRKYSIDELPQLLNVLAGTMSLVGPRPHQPREVERYLPHHRKVHNVRPGMTGMAQTSGRSDLDFEDEVRLDTFYIENWSPLLDLKILLKTPFAVLLRKGAY